MSAIPQKIREAINRCLVHGIAFAAYRLPGAKVRFIASLNNSSGADRGDAFVITPWGRRYGESTCIAADYDEISLMEAAIGKEHEGDNTFTFMPSTDKAEYAANLTRLIDLLQKRGGKTVISRIMSGECDSIDWAEAADRLFDRYPEAFCHIYYHPRTGAWLGATPEVLVSSDSRENSFLTMALAGTKKKGEAWDDKNRSEQQMVTDFIVGNLNELGAKVTTSQVSDLQYGDIAHLCTYIKCSGGENVSHQTICGILSPTPAVAGLPREKALAEIALFERHQRLCYGGYLTVENKDNTGRISYVNLRCAHFSGNRFTIYAGGGITAQSVPETEWAETEAKAKTLKDIINNLGNARSK